MPWVTAQQCDECWWLSHPDGRVAIVLTGVISPLEACITCATPTDSGIYVRAFIESQN